MDTRLNQGFSLLECLIALGLFAWIVMLCEGMFVIQQKATITVVDDIERLDTFRQLYLRLDPLIRRAGFLGMHSLSNGFPIDVQGNIPYSQMPQQALTIHHAQGKSWSPPLPAVLSNKVAMGTDVLIIEFANTSTLPKSGWFVQADGYRASIFHCDICSTMKVDEEAYSVTGAWQVIAIYMQKGEASLELMQKSLLPMADAANILTGLESFKCEEEGGLVKVTVHDKGEPISVWFGQGS